MTRQTLHPFQQTDLDAVHAEWKSGVTRTAVVWATGLGKGSLIAKLATDEVASGGRVLVLTHRAEIMGQLAARCGLYAPSIHVGQVQAERNEIHRPIVVAMVPTLAARLRAVTKANQAVGERPDSPRLRSTLARAQARLPQRPTLIVADECFPAGTMVGDVPIERIRSGDLVPSWDEIENQPVQRRVTATIKSVPSALVRVITDSGEVVCTPGHPFLTWTGWKTATELSSTYDSRIITGNYVQHHPSEYRYVPIFAYVERVQILEPGSDGTYGGACPGGIVYNLEVEDTHTYQVGRAGLVAHNCHHSVSSTWMETLRWAGAFDHVRTLGLTATLVRGDKKGLGDVWQSIAAERPIGWAVENGPGDGTTWLVKPRGRAVVTDHVDLTNAKISKGDYQDNELGEMVEQDTGQIVAAWRNHAADRLTVAFTPTVASATALRDEFVAAGVPAGLVLGTTPPDQRRRAYARLATGQDRVLVNVMVATEGWDCPPVSCVLNGRPTRLPGLYQQMIGRGLRTHLASGKTDCLVLDVVGASRHQKLATLVDLHKSAVYDESELEQLPCEQCNSPLDTCICDVTETEGLTEGPGLERDSGRRRLIGPAEYEDVDLFAKSDLTWLFTKGGTRFLPAGDRMAVLWDNGDETYSPWHCTTRRGRDHATGTWSYDEVCISEREDLDYGRRLAESWALLYAPTMTKRGASWRTRGGRPSEAQINYARGLSIPSPETMNKPRLSDEISIVIASQILD